MDRSQAHAHAEHERLKEALEEAQSRIVRLELDRRSLEAELHVTRAMKSDTIKGTS